MITEASTSFAVVRAAFGDMVMPGRFTGGFGNRMPTVVQLSPDDPFWQDNSFVPVAAQEAGYGLSLTGYPGITPLAGWDAASVSLAYRDLGLGRVWLLETNWQESLAGPMLDSDWDLMRYMITHAAPEAALR